MFFRKKKKQDPEREKLKEELRKEIAEEQKKRGFSKILKKIMGILKLLPLILFSLLIIAVLLAFWSPPKPKNEIPISEEAALSLEGKMMVLGDVKKGEYAIEVSEEEISSFAVLNSGNNIVKGANIRFKKGFLEGSILVNKALFGKDATVTFSASPKIENGEIKPNVRSVKLGRLPIPKSLVEEKIESFIDDSFKKDGGEIEITDIKIDDGKATIELKLNKY